MIGWCPTWLMLPGHAQSLLPCTFFLSIAFSEYKSPTKKKDQEIPTELIWRLWFSTRWNCYLPFQCIENATENRHVHFLSHPCFLILLLNFFFLFVVKLFFLFNIFFSCCMNFSFTRWHFAHIPLYCKWPQSSCLKFQIFMIFKGKIIQLNV